MYGGGDVYQKLLSHWKWDLKQVKPRTSANSIASAVHIVNWIHPYMFGNLYLFKKTFT